MAEVKAVFGAVVPSRDAEAEQVEVGGQDHRLHRRTSPGLLL